jgi:hypothetical protein
VLALAGFMSVMAPLTAYAGGPLLSGYGPPGAGEQAIVGSTLLGGPRGGAGSGGSSGSGSGGGGAVTGSSSVGTGVSAGRTGATPSSASGSVSPRAPRSSSAHRSRGSRSKRTRDSQVGRAPAFVYPSVSPSAQGDSSVIWISSGDVFPLIAIVVALALVGVLTLRLSRLQRQS